MAAQIMEQKNFPLDAIYEEFAVLYDNYPKWATVEKENGLKEGRKEERAAIFGALLSSPKAKLTERFGGVPQEWAGQLAQLTDPARIIDLSSAIYTVSSAEEFEAILLHSLNENIH